MSFHSPNAWWPTLIRQPWRQAGERMSDYPERFRRLFLPMRRHGELSYRRNPILVHIQEFPTNLLPKLSQELDQPQLLSLPFALLKREQLNRIYALLDGVDQERNTLRTTLLQNRETSPWFERHFDIMPDLERGRFIWVYTGAGWEERPNSRRERRSANQWLSALTEEVWLTSEQERHHLYPQVWQPLEINNALGEMIRNPLLTRLKTFPTNSLLPPMSTSNEERAILRNNPDKMEAEEVGEVLDLLQTIDQEYSLLKSELEQPEWFQRGFDILPDLELGVYRWVYSGRIKESANERTDSQKQHLSSHQSQMRIKLMSMHLQQLDDGQEESEGRPTPAGDPRIMLPMSETPGIALDWVRELWQHKVLDLKEPHDYPLSWVELTVLSENVLDEEGDPLVLRNPALPSYLRCLPTIPLRAFQSYTEYVTVQDAFIEQERFRTEVRRMLASVELQHELLMLGLLNDAYARQWFLQGFDIVPQFEARQFIWVYTGRPRFEASRVRPLLRYGVNK